MKTNLLFTVSCLFLFAVIGHAQQTRQLTAGEQSYKMRFKAIGRSFWKQDVNPQLFGLLHDPNIRAAWDVSDKQFDQIYVLIPTIAPEKTREIDEIAESLDDFDPRAENIDEETMKKYLDLYEKVGVRNATSIAGAINGTLTPEQQQKIKESLLANMAEVPIIFPGMFDALDLTEAQKREMEQIKKELEPEFEEILEHQANAELELQVKIGEIRSKEQQESNEAITPSDELSKKLKITDPVLRKMFEEIQSRSKTFTTKFKTKMFDVLTDEQWKRMLDLIDNLPAHAKILRTKLRERRGESEKAGEAWAPGPNSWRPGDPVPDGYRQQRQERGKFPRVNQSE
jgi:Spy/CpxP family protein refolding chaperone